MKVIHIILKNGIIPIVIIMQRGSSDLEDGVSESPPKRARRAPPAKKGVPKAGKEKSKPSSPEAEAGFSGETDHAGDGGKGRRKVVGKKGTRGKEKQTSVVDGGKPTREVASPKGKGKKKTKSESVVIPKVMLPEEGRRKTREPRRVKLLTLL